MNFNANILYVLTYEETRFVIFSVLFEQPLIVKVIKVRVIKGLKDLRVRLSIVLASLRCMLKEQPSPIPLPWSLVYLILKDFIYSKILGRKWFSYRELLLVTRVL